MADFLASVDPLMPWHMTAFHPDYKMTDGYRSTTVEDLMQAVEFGRAAGLKYLYPGNLPGEVGEWENTRCHHCNATVIKRFGFYVKQNRVASGASDRQDLVPMRVNLDMGRLGHGVRSGTSTPIFR